jgi:hypothetical protein
MAGTTGTTKAKTTARRQRKPAATKSAATRSTATKRSGKKLAIGTLSVGAAIGAIAAAGFAVLKLGKNARGSAEHVPTDLMGDTHPGPEDRAPLDFRPDPTASIPAGERDAFRPALAGVAAPTLVKGQARENERLDATPS